MTKEEHDKIIDFVNSEDYMLLNSYISKPYEETIIEQDKEIERLNKEIEEYKKDYDRIYTENCKLRQEHNITDISLLDENYRLNNIIDELEKWLEENIKISKAHDNQLGVNVCNTFLDKLKELKKGDDNG